MKPKIRVGVRSIITSAGDAHCDQFSASILLCWVDHLNKHERLKRQGWLVALYTKSINEIIYGTP